MQRRNDPENDASEQASANADATFDQRPRIQLSRRSLVLGTVALVGVGVGGGLWWRRQPPDHDARRLSVADAYAAAQAGEILLVDIRTPQEWAATGVPEGSQQIDMRRDDFLIALEAALAGRRDAPVALICARGVRSARTVRRMQAAGFTQVIDVPEGMLGSRAGPGWIASGLPVLRQSNS